MTTPTETNMTYPKGNEKVFQPSLSGAFAVGFREGISTFGYHETHVLFG